MSSRKVGDRSHSLYSPCLSLILASEVVERVIVGTAEWSELFKKHDFFHKYRYYLQIVASAANADLQSKWCVVSTASLISSCAKPKMQVRYG